MSSNSAESGTKGSALSVAWLLARLAMQNLLRRPTRTVMLLVAVALGTGAIFATFVVGRGIESSIEESFSRMGADLIVVPKETMLNITSALLTVQPTQASFDEKLVDEIRAMDGVAQAAPQTIYSVSTMPDMPKCRSNLIAFDPNNDFTVMPWLKERLPRALGKGDLLVGGRRAESVGEEIQPAGTPSMVYGKLGRSGVGPFDESTFATYDTLASLAATRDRAAVIPSFKRSRISAVLVRLAFGATPEQVRFALSRLNGVKVITGATVVTSTRQTTTALIGGMLAFAGIMLLGSLILVSLLFSAIISERRREIGLLSAIGTRQGSIVGLLVAEASFATSIGGTLGLLFGVALLFFFQHSLVYYLETMKVEFCWPSVSEMAVTALLCATIASSLGVLGALIPAWQASREESYRLIQGEVA